MTAGCSSCWRLVGVWAVHWGGVRRRREWAAAFMRGRVKQRVKQRRCIFRYGSAAGAFSLCVSLSRGVGMQVSIIKPRGGDTVVNNTYSAVCSFDQIKRRALAVDMGFKIRSRPAAARRAAGRQRPLCKCRQPQPRADEFCALLMHQRAQKRAGRRRAPGLRAGARHPLLAAAGPGRGRMCMRWWVRGAAHSAGVHGWDGGDGAGGAVGRHSQDLPLWVAPSL